MQDYYSMFVDAAGMFLFLGGELSILFLLICAAVSLLQQYIPDSKVQALLGGTHGRGYFLAALIGAITPFCSCSTIPMLRGLLKAKAGFGPTLTFLFASPLLNPIILALFVATFGIKVTTVYTCVALATSIVAGYILDKMNFEQYVIPENGAPSSACCASSSPQGHSQQTASTTCCSPPTSLQSVPQDTSCCGTQTQPLQPLQNTETSCCSTPKPLHPLQPLETKTSCCGEEPKPLQPLQPVTSCCGTDKQAVASCCSTGEQAATSCCDAQGPISSLSFGQKVKWAFADAWRQFKQVFPYLLIGVFLGALVYGFVPSDFIAKYASGDSIFAVPIAAVIGIPLYVRVEALIPLSAVLVGKGMGLGAVMALIIGGGGASLTEVILLKSMFRTPMIIAFLVVILGMAIAAGYLFQFVI